MALRLALYALPRSLLFRGLSLHDHRTFKYIIEGITFPSTGFGSRNERGAGRGAIYAGESAYGFETGAYRYTRLIRETRFDSSDSTCFVFASVAGSLSRFRTATSFELHFDLLGLDPDLDQRALSPWISPLPREKVDSISAPIKA